MSKNFLYVFVSVLSFGQFAQASDPEMTYQQIQQMAAKKSPVPVIGKQSPEFVGYNFSPVTNLSKSTFPKSLLTESLEEKSSLPVPMNPIVRMSPITAQVVACMDRKDYGQAADFVSEATANRRMTPVVATELGDKLISLNTENLRSMSSANMDSISKEDLELFKIDQEQRREALVSIISNVNYAVSKKTQVIHRLEDRYNALVVGDRLSINELAKFKKENDAKIARFKDLK